MRSPLITVMSNAAIAAGRGLLRDFGEVDQLQVSRKGTSNFVTQSDIRTEKKLVAELKRARPEFGFLVEESGEIPGTDPSHRWIIDPLDGTNNFIHAHPYFCISIALERTIKPGVTEMMAGVIYDPIHNDLFFAEKRKGAFLNDKRITTSGRDSLDDAMLVTGNPRYAASSEQAFSRLKNVALNSAFVRYTGATALDLAYVAAGRFEACWYGAIQPWDIAAGILMVEEAGGIVTDLRGEPANALSPTLVAGNRALQPKVLKLLAG